MAEDDRSAVLAGKVVVVTGAGRGIGRAVALDAARHGAAVAVVDSGGALDAASGPAMTVAQSVVAEIEKAGGRAIACQEDIGVKAGVERVFARTCEAFGQVDGLVCAAGLYVHKSILETSEAEWDDVIKSHLKGHFLCTQAAARLMIAGGGGSIVHFSSAGALSAPAWSVAYSTAKSGVLALAHSASAELAAHAIRVNCVLPGASTRMTDKIYGEIGMLIERPEAAAPGRGEGSGILAAAGLKSSSAEGTWRDPANVAPFVTFLLSEGSAGVNGRSFAVVGYQVTSVGDRPYGRTIRNEGPWTQDGLQERFRLDLASEPASFAYTWPPP